MPQSKVMRMVQPSSDEIIYHNQALNTEYKCVYNDNEDHQGFCSWFNGLLMAFDYSTFVGRKFSFNTDTLAYGHWQDFFIVKDESFISKPRVENYIDLHLIYSIQHKTGDLVVKEKMEPRVKTLYFRHITMPFFTTIYQDFNSHLVRAYANHSDKNILRRRALAHQLWFPRQEILDETDRIKSFMLSFDGRPARKIIGVHIRRGDKIKYEAKALPVEEYFKAIMEFKLRDSQVDCVLIVSDDEAFAQVLKTMLTRQKLMSFLLFDLRMPDPMVEQGWDQWSLLKASKENRYQHTFGLVLSLHLLAESDYVVCTFSSNMCRTIQVIRRQPLDTVKSLDEKWTVF